MDGNHKFNELVMIHHHQYLIELYQNYYLEASSCIAGQEIFLLF